VSGCTLYFTKEVNAMEQLTNILMPMEGITVVSTIVRVLLATLIGGCIGMDRGRHGRVAGTRTHILVCLGAAITTLLGLYTAECLGYNNDPMRVGAQVISGVGFLGVGTIVIRNQAHVKGLTTAAGLWTTASIGLAVGAGFYLVAVLSFVVVMVTMSVLAHLEQHLRKNEVKEYYVELESMEKAREFYQSIKDCRVTVDIVAAKSGLPGHVGMDLAVNDPTVRKDIFEHLENNEDVAIAVPIRL
jgi:putative Mg2+ transporter-C (MgtC) family protein